ncbi:universal stress protein [Arcticibacterium luteifluviistationis]|uniref:Universal stress protein n=1 Tax=Arcticibacterium luteifluviistationis TaxID=1784714 RepID=A0A2Z4G6L3_9BACT|nr:universal stress protein [Arcticibacterium luteifluviistationis]AWV96797.1 universal stress protein [Arcticibacterium luteifluviistationis]
MKKVLITLDYDPTSQKVAKSGFDMAKTMHAEITLLHVISKPLFYYTQYSGMYQQLELRDDLKVAAQDFLNKTKKDLGTEGIKILVKEGESAEQILLAAKEINADIIVLGTHSRKWLENILMGSVAEEVLKDASIPLFIVPTKKTEKETIGKK